MLHSLPLLNPLTPFVVLAVIYGILHLITTILMFVGEILIYCNASSGWQRVMYDGLLSLVVLMMMWSSSFCWMGRLELVDVWDVLDYGDDGGGVL